MNEHKYATILRALANGVPLSEFEGRILSKTTNCYPPDYDDMGHALSFFMLKHPDQVDIRRKQRTITVNGFVIAAPLDAQRNIEKLRGISATYYVASIAANDWHYPIYAGGVSRLCLNRGLLHDTKENAIAHAKAMLGIDPNLISKE